MRKENLAILLQDGSDNRNNKSFVLEVVKQYGILLGYASDELRNDKEVVLAAVQNDCDALKYASEELKNDKEVVLTAIKSEWYNGPVMQSTPKYGFSFQQASEELKKDPEIIEAAKLVMYNGMTEEELENRNSVLYSKKV